MSDLLVFDWEVFKHDNMVTIINLMQQTTHSFVNDLDGFRQFYAAHVGDIWVGHNARNYDQYITKAAVCGFDLKAVSDYIIVKEQPGWMYSDLFRRVPLIVYDTMPAIPVSLKTYEAMMGNDIQETSVPFDIDRPLTQAELDEVLKYNIHDVEQTAEVFRHRFAEFSAQLALVNLYGMPIDYVAKTQARLAAVILGAKPRVYNDEWDIRLPETLQLNKYRYVADWFLDPKNHDAKSKLETMIAGVPHTFAWGGLHGAIPKYNYTCASDEIMLMIDVNQLYPSLMIVYNLISRSVSRPHILVETVDKSIQLKKEGKKKEREPYKRFNNIIYGAEGDQTNPMYDPLHRVLVCVFGQLLILDLVDKIEDICQIIQSNTDGLLVLLQRKDRAEFEARVAAWEVRTGLKMGTDEFRTIYQGDVNNYLAVDIKGKVKAKGAYVKDLSPLDYDLPIVNKAIRARLVDGTPVEKTILGCDELIEYQKIVKVSSKYYAGWHRGKPLQGKTFRVFASCNPFSGPICKIKEPGAKPEKFANTPEQCFIDNGQVRDKKVPAELDKYWYINTAKTRLAEKFSITD